MSERYLPRQEYIQNITPFAEWRANTQASIQHSLQLLDEQVNPVGNRSLLASKLILLAMMDYYLGKPIDQVLQSLASAAEYELAFVQQMVNGVPGAKQWSSPLGFTLSMSAALITKRWESARSLAQAIKEATAARRSEKNQYFNLINWMLLHLILGEDKEASLYAQAILTKQSKKNRQFYELQARIGIALINQDVTALTKSLQDFLVAFNSYARRGTYKDGPAGMMCFEGMAYLVLAQQRHMLITIEHPFLFLDLLSS